RDARAAAAARRARRDEGDDRRRDVRSGALLLLVAGQVLEYLDPYGQGAGPTAEPVQAHRGLWSPQVLPHLRARDISRGEGPVAEARRDVPHSFVRERFVRHIGL